MDLLTAHRLVVGTEDGLKRCVRDFSGIKEAADQFVEWANDELLEKDCEMEVEVALPEKQVKKKKIMPGELAEDEPLTAAERDFEAELASLATQWERLKLSPLEEYNVRTSGEDDSPEGTEDGDEEESCDVEGPELKDRKDTYSLFHLRRTERTLTLCP
ncbi:unnamed protein product [Merluccius merluccius]